MTISSFILVSLYIILIVLNYKGYKDNKVNTFLTIVTVSLSTFMLFSANSADLDWSETKLDMSGYRTIYEQYDVLEHEDFNMYYMFYGSMYLGQSFGLPFRTWWMVMSILAMGVVFIATRIHKFSFNLFLATFMAYHEIVFYSGFKFFYGFCFLLLAYGFLFWRNRKGQLLFALFTCMAGGFHMMYYFFLVLLIKPIRRPKRFVGVIVTITIILTVIMQLSGSAKAFLMPFFDTLDNEHINRYTAYEINAGFYIAVLIHLVVVYIVYRIRKYKITKGFYKRDAEALYYTVLISLLFCPFYSVALTFMRLITSFSLVVITASSRILKESYQSRSLCTNMSLLFVAASYLMRLVIGGFIQTSIIPYFDVF